MMRLILTLTGELTIAATISEAAAAFRTSAADWHSGHAGAYPELRLEWHGGAKCWAPDQVEELLQHPFPQVAVELAIQRA
jgi:hypothetical protein